MLSCFPASLEALLTSSCLPQFLSSAQSYPLNPRPPEQSHKLPILMTQPGGAPMLICNCSINAACLGILLLVGLSLGPFYWLALGVAHLLLIAKSFEWLPLGSLLPQCLFVPVGQL